MPSPRSLRPIILLSARQFSSTPCRLLHSPFDHQHHHRRTPKTLCSSAKSQIPAFLAGFLAGCAVTFGTAIWFYLEQSTNAAVNVLPHMARAAYTTILEKVVVPNLHRVVREYLGCQNFEFEEWSPSELTSSSASDDVAAQFANLGIYKVLDADATSENIKGNVIGFCMAAEAREETELLFLLGRILMDFDSKGLLKREGMAVCLVSYKSNDSKINDKIWVYSEGLKRLELAWSGRTSLAYHNLGT